MKEIDEETRGVKLNSIKDLLKMLTKDGLLEKLPKKGVSMMSVSMSKPEDEEMDMEMPPEMEESEDDEYSFGEPEVPSELMDLVREMLAKKSE